MADPGRRLDAGTRAPFSGQTPTESRGEPDGFIGATLFAPPGRGGLRRRLFGREILSPGLRESGPGAGRCSPARDAVVREFPVGSCVLSSLVLHRTSRMICRRRGAGKAVLSEESLPLRRRLRWTHFVGVWM